MHPVPAVHFAAFYFAYFGWVGAFAPYFGLYLQSIGQSALQIGVLLSLMQLMRIFTSHLWAAAADRSGRRARLLRFALAAALLAYCGVFVTQSFSGLFVVLAVLALFNGAAMPLFESLVFLHLRDELSGYGRLRMWGSVGFIAAVLGVGPALDAFGMAALPAVLAAMLGAALVIALVLRDPPGAARQGTEQSVWPVLRRPEVATLFGACFLMSVAHGPLYTFYSIYLADHGYAKTTVGLMWSLGTAAEIAAFFGSGALFTRWKPRAVLVFSFGCAVVRFLAVAWGVESLAVLGFAQLLHAASFGSYHAAAIALVNRWFSTGQRSRAQALYLSLSFGAGGMVGGLAAGLAWDAIGPAWTFTGSALCAAAGMWLAARSARSTPVAAGR